jgi:NAD(P)-dependent dehydrogenase (short-subunit alcohol dehydrogenase family)
MKRRNWGRVLFVSSESALQIPDNMIHYGMTKTAQLAISRGLAETCAGTQVTVNAILPGPTLSDGNKAAIAKRAPGRPLAEVEKEFFDKVRPSSLLKRYATPEEVASMAAYVCSPLASATNGAALRCEGGVVRACFG